MIGSAIPKPLLAGGDKGRNKKVLFLTGSPALWAGSFTLNGEMLDKQKDTPYLIAYK